MVNLNPLQRTQNEPRYPQRRRIRENTVKSCNSRFFIHYGHIVKINIRLNSLKIQKKLSSSNIKDYALFSAIFNWQKNSPNMAIWSSSMRPRIVCSPKITLVHITVQHFIGSLHVGNQNQSFWSNVRPLWIWVYLIHVNVPRTKRRFLWADGSESHVWLKRTRKKTIL